MALSWHRSLDTDPHGGVYKRLSAERGLYPSILITKIFEATDLFSYESGSSLKLSDMVGKIHAKRGIIFSNWSDEI